MWNDIVAKNHTGQAIWWLNGFWKSLEKDADEIWDMVHHMIQIECGKEKRYGRLKWTEKEGTDLDQFQAHRFLEHLGETCTVKELRAKVKNLDVDRNKRLALCEYLADKYDKSVQQVIDAPQGGQAAQEALDRAVKLVETSTEKMNAAISSSELAHTAHDEAKKSKQLSDEAKKECEEAVNAVESQEASRAKKIGKLKDKINNKKLSTMKINTAKNELAQVEGEDPLPLRKAKLTQKAALKKSKRAAKVAKKEEKKAEAATVEAQTAKEEAKVAHQEAVDALTDLKENGDGIAHGQVWWLEKEMAERQKYMPRGK